jgi:hypothetical protein
MNLLGPELVRDLVSVIRRVEADDGAPRLRKSGDFEMTSSLIETDTNDRPTSAPAAPPMMTANVSQPGTAAPTIATRHVRRPRPLTSPSMSQRTCTSC